MLSSCALGESTPRVLAVPVCLVQTIRHSYGLHHYASDIFHNFKLGHTFAATECALCIVIREQL